MEPSHGKHTGMRKGVVVVQVAKDDLWRYAAASMYREHNLVMLRDDDCLACVVYEYDVPTCSKNLPFDVIIC